MRATSILPTRSRGRRHLRVLAGLLVLAASLVAGGGPGLGGGGALAADGVPWSVTASPVSNITDGQLVSITVKTDSSLPIYQIEARVCRGGVDYQPNVGNRPSPDFELGGPNCPDKPLSSSADIATVDSTAYPGVIQPAGETTTIRVGSGVVAWTSPDGQQRTLQCDETSPCALVVELKTSSGGVVSWIPWSTKLTYLPSDPIAGCGGPAAGILSTGGPDRLNDAWVSWTLQGCRRPGQSGAPTRGIFSGEGEAMLAFDSGQLDLAYTAAAYNPKIGFVPDTGLPRRAGVPVPVGVNAVVLAVAGGSVGTNGKTVPYRDIRLTLDEVAALLSGGASGIEPHVADIFARNPELARTGLFANNVFQVGATSTSEATHWFLTDLLDRAVPTAWRVPDAQYFAPDNGKDRGVDASFALASPSFSQALNLFTGRPSLRKNLLSVAGPGGAWVLTDLETARATGMTVVQLPNADGEFLAPTPENMQAAVRGMSRDDQGMLLPDPTATAPIDGVTPYPLTYVEYAYAPAEPLVEPANCTLRTSSQALLTDWLTYITTTGQGELPAGIEPLSPALAAEAATAVAAVGASPVTGPCKDVLDAAANPPPTAPAPPDTLEVTGGFGASLGPVGSFGGDGSFVSDGVGGSSYAGSLGYDEATDPGAAPATAPQEALPVELAASARPLPDYAGNRSASRLLTVVSLLGIILLTAIAAVVSAGRRSGERPA